MHSMSFTMPLSWTESLDHLEHEWVLAGVSGLTHIIESLPFFDVGKPTKSIEISTQGLAGIGNGVYSPCDCILDFAFLQAMHYSQIRCISLYIFSD